MTSNKKITHYSVIYKYAKKKDEDVPVVSCCSEAGRMKCAATNKSCSRSLIQVKFTALNSEVNSTLGKNWTLIAAQLTLELFEQSSKSIKSIGAITEINWKCW